METLKNDLILIYDENKRNGKQTLAIAKSLTNKIDMKEVHSTRMTETMIYHILDCLGMQPSELIDKNQPFFKEHLEGKNFDERGWLNILRKNKELLKAPIAVYGTSAVLCNTPTDILKLRFKSSQAA